MRECKFTLATDAEGYEWCDEHGYIAVTVSAAATDAVWLDIVVRGE